MKSLKSLLIVSLFLAPAHFATAELSVWESAKRQTNSFEGKIKAIVSDEADRQVVLKIETTSHQIQMIKVCDRDIGYDFRTFETSEKMNRMREAFRGGRRVKVSYNGPFDRCLSDISEVSSVTASAGQGDSI